MEIFELEDKISDLGNRIDELRDELNHSIGFIVGTIAELSEDYITTAIINNLLPHSIQEYIVVNYEKFSKSIVSILLKSEYYDVNNLFRYHNSSHRMDYVKILKEHTYLHDILANPNLQPYYKKEIKKYIAKHKRDLKKR
jgi:hypothetical protein